MRVSRPGTRSPWTSGTAGPRRVIRPDRRLVSGLQARSAHDGSTASEHADAPHGGRLGGALVRARKLGTIDPARPGGGMWVGTEKARALGIGAGANPYGAPPQANCPGFDSSSNPEGCAGPTGVEVGSRHD